MTLAKVRAHLRSRFAHAGIDAQPDAASVMLLGAEAIEVLRFDAGADRVVHYVSLGCSRHPMVGPPQIRCAAHALKLFCVCVIPGRSAGWRAA